MGVTFGVKEVCDVTLYDLSTGKPVLFMNALKMSNLEQATQNTQARGGRGAAKLLTWEYDKNITFNCQNALLDLNALGLQNATTPTTGAVTGYQNEILTAVADVTGKTKVTLSKAPKAGTIYVFKSGDVSVNAQSIAFTQNTQDLQFADTDVAVGEKVHVFYQYQTTAQARQIKIEADKFGGFYKVVGDTVWRDEATGLDVPAQLVIPRAKVMSDFTMNMQGEGDPATFDFKLEVYQASRDDKTMLQWTLLA